MEYKTTWVTRRFMEIGRDVVVHSQPLWNSNDEDANGNGSSSSCSIDSVLPDDLLERILACLPVATIFRAGAVCRRWHQIVTSDRFLWQFSNFSSQKPWYYMFTSNDEASGLAYDPILKKWHGVELPHCIATPNWFVASSCGLVCFMDSNSRNKLYVGNPVTKMFKRIEPPELNESDYTTVSISVNQKSKLYTVVVAKSKQVPDDFLHWNLSIQVYDSETQSWVTCANEDLRGWRGGDESMICNGIFYCMVYSTGVMGSSERHGVIMYDIMTRSTRMSMIRSSIPCSLTCGRLINLQNKLVMVGGIGKPDRPDVIKGIGIWVLEKTGWQLVARMPHKYFQGFGDVDDVFSSSGTDDLIYIQCYGSPSLLVYDASNEQWKWSQKSPVSKRFPLQLFTGFCFEPRLDIAP